MCLPGCPGTPYSKRSAGTPAFRASASAAAGRGHGTAPLDGAAAAGAVAVVVVVAAAEPDEPPPHAPSRHRHVAALASKGGALCIQGSAGTGKTRLLTELVVLAQTRGLLSVTVVTGPGEMVSVDITS